MKKLALLLSLVLVAGVTFAAQSTPPAQPAPAAPAAAPATQPAPAAPATKTHTVEAEVVSADATAKTLTIKGEAGKENKTVAVDTSAVGSLKSLKSGDKVKLTCRDDSMGAHQAVTEIKVEKPKVQ